MEGASLLYPGLGINGEEFELYHCHGEGLAAQPSPWGGLLQTGVTLGCATLSIKLQLRDENAK